MVDIIHRNDFVKLRITITALEENNLTNVYKAIFSYSFNSKKIQRVTRTFVVKSIRYS